MTRRKKTRMDQSDNNQQEENKQNTDTAETEIPTSQTDQAAEYADRVSDGILGVMESGEESLPSLEDDKE